MGFAAAGCAIALIVRAQRATQPIAGSPRQRLGQALAKGRFGTDGVASGAQPGVFVVVAVDTRADTLLLRDEGGRTDTVHVNAAKFDLDTLKAGDEVEVDFVLQPEGSTRLEAGTLWKVER
ncbi:hypothetical protein H8N03_04805 [Ramlibacter sp. USB13]|uniref:DUF5666 domain-containing protein n=1 Tax=Ramlibacter cellulosilyticus TaxID=2764187 RepID=A0A923MP38_9BURK|nr:hypothetical protein [Ramlibacter cellulosilyticus]MBC5782253.1 hypothetical protein [Ramlibacter cellulosilyticus]